MVNRLHGEIVRIMALPEELEESFDQDLRGYEEGQKMVWISSIERLGMKRGLEQGLEQGLEKGLKKGLKKGLVQGHASGKREGLLEGIALILDAKFGAAGRKLLAKARALPDVASLRRFARFLAKADDLAQVRGYFE